MAVTDKIGKKITGMFQRQQAMVHIALLGEFHLYVYEDHDNKLGCGTLQAHTPG